MKKLLTIAFLLCSILQAVADTWTDSNGIVWNYSVYNGNAVQVKPNDKSSITGVLVIPEYLDSYPIISIANEAFSECNGLTSVQFPNSVEYIGNYAFFNCVNLTTITLPNSLIRINESAFRRCEKLESLNLPGNLKEIGKQAFCSCEGLTTLTIPGNVETIGHEAFSGCYNIEDLTISEGVQSIGYGAFTGFKITSINIPKSVTQINSYGNPFYYCRNLETITVDADNPNYYSQNNSLIEKSSYTLVAASINTVIPIGIKIIGPFAFYGLPIETIAIPNTVTTIGNSAFSNCEELVSITIPSSVTKIDSWVLSYCPKIESIKLSSGLKTIGEGAFSTNSNYLKSVIIPEGVTTIESQAFRDCYALEFVSLPSSLTSSLYSGFEGCNNLSEVEVNSTSPIYVTQYTFPNRANATLYVPAGSKAAYQAAEYWRDFENINEVGYIGDVNSELTGETGIACFVVNKTGKLGDYYVQAGKPQKVKIIGEVDANDLRDLYSGGYYYEMYYTNYVDLSEAHINACTYRYHYTSGSGPRNCPDNYLNSEWLGGISSESDDDGWYGPSTIVLPMTLQEFEGDNDQFRTLYSEQTTPFKTTITRSYNSDSQCKFHVPSGTRASWIEQTTFPESVLFMDGPSKNVNVSTAGQLWSKLNSNEIETLNELTISGYINAKDFSTLKRMTNLVLLRIDATWEAYEGYDGPVAGQTSYQAGEIPANVFQNHNNLERVSLYGYNKLSSTNRNEGFIIGDYAFDGCTRLNSFYCKGVSSLGDFCFRNTKVQGAKLLGTSYISYTSGEEDSNNPHTENNREFEHIGLQPFFGVEGSKGIYTEITPIPWEYAMFSSDWFDNSDEWDNDYYDYLYNLENFTVIPGYWDRDRYNQYRRPYFSGVTNKEENLLYAMTTGMGYDLTLPTSITTLADYAVSGLQIRSINLGSVTTIGDGFLYQCPLLQSITCDNAAFKSEDGVLYTAEKKTLVKYPCAKTAEELTIPSTVEQISKWAFEGTQALNTITMETATPPTLAEGAFDDFDVTAITLNVPYGSKNAYMAANGWNNFNIVEMEPTDVDIPEAIYYLKNVETGKYLNTGNAFGTHAILADEPLPARISKQQDGSYTIFFPLGSQNQQLLFRDDETNVYVDYSEEFVNACPYWTITAAGGDTYHIQTLTTHETYGQSAMPGTYLGNNPNKEGNDNDVDGNVQEGMNITWQLIPENPHTEAQATRLQELITQATTLNLNTEEAQALIDDENSTYTVVQLAINALQNLIIENVEKINIVKNSDLEGTDVSCFFSKEDLTLEDPVLPSTIVDGAGKDGSRGIVITSIDGPEYEWDTQFFLRLPQTLPAGTMYRVSFDYKASQEAFSSSQSQGEPGDYISSEGIGDVNYTTEWQHFENQGIITEGQSPADHLMRTIAFQLAEIQTATTYYFDNIVFEIDLQSYDITFADANVKSICVENWDTNNDGELSVAEAAAVTELDDVFNGNNEITSFDELRYFTGLTELPDWRSFDGCTALKSITIPANVTSIDGGSFANCASIEQISVDPANTKYESPADCNAIIEKTANKLVVGCGTIPDGITTIGGAAFWGRWGMQRMDIPETVTTIEGYAFAYCASLSTITLPASVNAIGDETFSNCGNLTDVWCYADTPVSITENVFTNRANATLHVPYGSKAAYAAADYWNEFNIVEMLDNEAIYYLKNVETGKYLNTGNACGTHAILADEPLPARISKQQDGSYTIFFPLGSQNQQLLFRDDETNVYVDYSEEFVNACPYWTITAAGGDTYHIQTLTTHETYGQSAMPGTYLGNNPNKEGNDNDVDGNVQEGMNITWQFIPEIPHTEAQATRLQELITQATTLNLNTDEAQALIDDENSTYTVVQLAINALQNLIIENVEKINIVKNSDLEGTDVSCFYSRENCTEDDTVLPSTIVDGAGKDGSRGIVITSIDDPSVSWDTQFFLRLPQTLPAGTMYRVTFDYKASQEAFSSTQSQGEPGDYISSEGIGDVNYTTEWQHFENQGIITEGQSPADHLMRTIAFQLAEIQTATTYYFDNIVFEIDQSHYSPEETEANRLEMADITGIAGGVTNLPVSLENEDCIGDIQFNLNLPEGIDVNSVNGNFKVSYSDRLSGLTCNLSYKESEGCYKVLIYGLDTSVTGNSGNIMTISLSISNELSQGDYSLEISDIVLSKEDGTKIKPNNAQSTLTLVSAELGDANKDGDIDVADIRCIANYILGKHNNAFDEQAADANGDGEIDVADIRTIANRILHGNVSSARRIMETQIEPQ